MSIAITSAELGDLELIYNESIVLTSKNDSIRIRLPEKGGFWGLIFTFTDDLTKNPFSSVTTFSGNDITINLNRWYSDNWAENIKPFTFESKNKNFKIFVKIKTSANLHQDFRTFQISVWRKN